MTRIEIAIKIAAAKVLFKEIGFFKTLSVAAKIDKDARKGKPFDILEKPESQKDIDTRNLIGEAVLLYRELQKTYSQKEAEAIVRKVITNSAIAQLRHLIPILEYEKLSKMGMDERKELFCDIVDRFPNTDWKMTNCTEQEVTVCMTRCRIVELLDAVGCPELRNACCAGDKLYFDMYQKDINFKRDTMIGEGDKQCDFIFSIKDKT